MGAAAPTAITHSSRSRPPESRAGRAAARAPRVPWLGGQPGFGACRQWYVGVLVVVRHWVGWWCWYLLKGGDLAHVPPANLWVAAVVLEQLLHGSYQARVPRVNITVRGRVTAAPRVQRRLQLGLVGRLEHREPSPLLVRRRDATGDSTGARSIRVRARARRRLA